MTISGFKKGQKVTVKTPKPKEKKRPAMKDRSISWLLNTLQRVFNKWIRLYYSDENGYCKCCTCGVTRKYNDRMDAGHWKIVGNSATRFDAKNVHPQCRYCNKWRNGRTEAHRIHIDSLHGKGTADAIEARHKKLEQWDRFELIERIKEYRVAVKQLKQKKGL